MRTTPKEKAEQLFIKFNKEALQQIVPLIDRFGRKEIIKQCVLVGVNEMIDNAGFIWGGHNTETGLSARDEYRKYWQEVKDEVQKL